MYEVGQRVRIRERTWVVLDDHDGGMGSGDRVLRMRGVDTQPGGVERVFVYRLGGGAGADEEAAGLEQVVALPAPELRWSPWTPPSQWERLQTAYRLSIAHSAGHLLGLSRARLVIEPYQLAPVLRVMSAPRQRFLLAEDVGMGKTIEAGLAAMELIARGRGDRILIVVPAALRWREVDLDAAEPCLRVIATAHYRWGDPIFRRAKTDHSKRRVLLTPQAVAILRRWRVAQGAERRRAGVAWRTSAVAVRPGHEGETISFDGLVFSNEIGRPLYEQTVRRAHRRICQAVGVPVNRPHDLRHTFATLMLSAGVNPKVVSEMLGHASVNLTLTLYSHVLPHMQSEAVERLSHLLAPVTSATPNLAPAVVVEPEPSSPSAPATPSTPSSAEL